MLQGVSDLCREIALESARCAPWVNADDMYAEMAVYIELLSAVPQSISVGFYDVDNELELVLSVIDDDPILPESCLTHSCVLYVRGSDGTTFVRAFTQNVGEVVYQ